MRSDDATGSGEEGVILNNDSDNGRAESEWFKNQLALDPEESNREMIWWQGMLDALVRRARFAGCKMQDIHCTFPGWEHRKSKRHLSLTLQRETTFDPACSDGPIDALFVRMLLWATLLSTLCVLSMLDHFDASSILHVRICTTARARARLPT